GGDPPAAPRGGPGAPAPPPGGGGNPRWGSRVSAASPRMIAAVLAVLASAQVAAATDTVRHTGAAGSPERGSRMWCRTSPPRRQRRAAVLDVARPPDRIATTPDGPAGASSRRPVTSCTR